MTHGPEGATTDPAETGARLEATLSDLAAEAGPAVTARVEEVVRLLAGLYGAALEHTVDVLQGSGPQGADVLRRLADDPLLASLFALHDLHPMPLDLRVQEALDGVRPYLGSHAGGVELLGVDEDGTVRLRLEGTCHGCPSSMVTVTTAIEQAIRKVAPEAGEIAVEGAEPLATSAPSVPPAGAAAPAATGTAGAGSTSSGLLQIQSRPPADAPGLPGQANGRATAQDARRATAQPPAEGDAWVALDGLADVPPGRLGAVVAAGGARLVVGDVDGSLVAYRDGCPGCAASLDGATVSGHEAACPACGRRYDVQLAGRAVDGGTGLSPVPLLGDVGGARVAAAALAGGVR